MLNRRAAAGPTNIEYQGISVVVPCYRCAPFLRELYERLCTSLEPIATHFEIIFVNDASPDHDWALINEIAELDKRVIGVDLSRNFGQHYAITAGLDISTGEWIVVMDGDLQDEPEEIPRLYELAIHGYEMVLGRRWVRKDNLFRRLVSSAFYSSLSYLTGTSQDAAVGNFGIYHRKVVDAIRIMPENLRYLPVMAKWVGFKSASLNVSHHARVGTNSSYTVRRMFSLATNVMIAFSDKPLHLVTQVGLVLSGCSGLVAVIVLYQYFFGLVKVQGWTSLMVLMGFVGGLTIFVLGIIGIYLGKVFDESKGRPLYLVRECTQREVSLPYPRNQS